MAGMPNITETSDETGGAGEFFLQIERWLNDPDLQTRKHNRAAARARTANNLGGVGTTTLANNPGIGHFNKHWRKLQTGGGNPPPGDRPWWPNITTARVNEQMGAAFTEALAPEHNARRIRIRWTCRERNINAGNSAFTAYA